MTETLLRTLHASAALLLSRAIEVMDRVSSISNITETRRDQETQASVSVPLEAAPLTSGTVTEATRVATKLVSRTHPRAVWYIQCGFMSCVLYYKHQFGTPGEPSSMHLGEGVLVHRCLGVSARGKHHKSREPVQTSGTHTRLPTHHKAARLQNAFSID